MNAAVWFLAGYAAGTLVTVATVYLGWKIFAGMDETCDVDPFGPFQREYCIFCHEPIRPGQELDSNGYGHFACELVEAARADLDVTNRIKEHLHH